MDIEQAFARLELSLDATEPQIDAAYRRLSKNAHPDRPSGDNEAQSRLNEARETALAYTKIRGAVVPISPASLTQKIRSAIATYNREPANETARNQFKRSTNYLNTLKWFAWVAGALSAVIALAGNNIGILEGGEQNARVLKTMLQVGAGVFGMFGLVLQFMLKSMEWRLEQFLSRISDKVGCARQLSKALEYVDSKTIDERDVTRHVAQRSSEFPFPVPIDYGPVLLQKAVEHNLLAPLEVDEITPGFKQKYTLNFTPSRFRPPPPSPPKPRTLSDVRSGIAFGLGTLGVFGAITIGLMFFGFGWWAVIPGFLAFAGAMGTIVELTELAKLQKPDQTLAGVIWNPVMRWFRK